MAFRAVQHALTEKQHKLKKLLDIPDEKTKEEFAQDIQDRINDYFRTTGARLKIDSIKRVICNHKKFMMNQVSGLKLKNEVSEEDRFSLLKTIMILEIN